MSPELIPLIEKLGTMTGQAGMLMLAVYFLGRTLKSQYEGRITALEGHVVRCDEDRIKLREEIRCIQNERIGKQDQRIGKLERLLEREEG